MGDMMKMDKCDPSIEDCKTINDIWDDQTVQALGDWHDHAHFMDILEMNPWGGMAAFSVMFLANAVILPVFHFVYRNGTYFDAYNTHSPMYRKAWYTFWITLFTLNTVGAISSIFPYLGMFGDINMYIVGGIAAAGALMGMVIMIMYLVAAGQAYRNNALSIVDTIQREITMMLAIDAVSSIFLLVNAPGWFAGNMLAIMSSEYDKTMKEEMEIVEEDIEDGDSMTMEDATVETTEDNTDI